MPSTRVGSKVREAMRMKKTRRRAEESRGQERRGGERTGEESRGGGGGRGSGLMSIASSKTNCLPQSSNAEVHSKADKQFLVGWRNEG